MKQNLIFGHKTPDTDSVCAAISLANLKNILNEKSIPYVLGKINKETDFVLKYFEVDTPDELDNVRVQIKDLNYDRVKPFKVEQSIHFAYFFMNENRLRTLPIVDRYDIIKYAVEINVKLIIVTGDLDVPDDLLKMALKNNVNIISTPYNTYYTARNIGLSKYVNYTMKSENLVYFTDEDYLDDCKDDIENSKHSKFPIISKDKKYLGLLSRGHLINPSKKKVILVDHNELGQSADGIEEAEILEVIDHHKIGDIKTSIPISFRNIPLGSTNTIIFNMYKESGVEIERKIAGLMLSGIISDTMLLKSPTTTEKDRLAVNELVNLSGVNLHNYSMEMFKAGTSLMSKTIKEIIYQDLKKFNLEYKDVGISQVFTMDINEIMNKKLDFITLIDKITEEKDYYVFIMAVTDIVNEGSYIFYTSTKDRLVSNIFETDNVYEGMYVDKCVSRKKQIVPSVINAIRKMV